MNTSQSNDAPLSRRESSNNNSSSFSENASSGSEADEPEVSMNNYGKDESTQDVHMKQNVPPESSDTDKFLMEAADANCRPGNIHLLDDQQADETTTTDHPAEELSPRTHRKQLGEFVAASAECWDDHLSEDEGSRKLPSDCQADMIRLEINRKKVDPPETLRDTSNDLSSNNDAFFADDDIPIKNNNPEYHMSLPEQLLRNRLARKQKLQRKNELYMKHYQNHKRSNSSQSINKEVPFSNDGPTQHVKRYSQDNFNFLSGDTGSNKNSISTHLSDQIGDDNISVVASSNGSLHRPSYSSPSLNNTTPHKQPYHSPKPTLDSLPQRHIVPMPDEADRKRFIGCLAAVLASSYAYETAPQLLVKKKTVGASHVISNPVPTEGNADEEQLWHTQEPMHQQYLSQKQLKQSPRSVQHAHSMGDIPTRNSFQSSSKPNFFSSFNNKFDVNSQNPPSQLTAELAEIRHRIRRHAVLSELLVSSAEMLLLDPMHARAYLPMLEGLLTTKAEENTKPAAAVKKESWKGRGFGGGGMHPNVHLDGTMSVHGAPSSDNKWTSSNRISSSHHGTLPSSHSKQLNPASKPQVPMQNIALSNSKIPAPNPKPIVQSMKRLEIPNSINISTTTSTKDQPSSLASASSYSPLDTIIVGKENIVPFLETMTPGAGFRCMALLLLNHLLRDGRGYDARIRHAFKRLAVIILSHELKVGGILRVDLEDDDNLDALLWGDRETNTNSEEEYNDADELALLATRKFEAMEHAIAAKLIAMSKVSDTTAKKSQKKSFSSSGNAPKQLPNNTSTSSVSHGRIALAPKENPLSSQHGLSKEQLLRGLKIGTAGAVGATLFALTGGLAAPGIAAGLAAVAGGSAVAVGVTTVLSSAAVVSTLFGVGGAGLAGYKMHRRTKGLTEFDFQKEGMSKSNEAELFSTVCISGWLRDARDFQRPWGVSPSHPRIVDKLELLERFYFIHNPSNLDRCQKILKHWKGRYFQLWKALNEKYGSDPSNLFPLKEGPRISAELTHEETEAITFLLDELGHSDRSKSEHSMQTHPESSLARPRPSPPEKIQSVQNDIKDSLTARKGLLESFGVNSPGISSISSNLSLFEEDTQGQTSDAEDKCIQVEAASQSSSIIDSKQQTDQKPDKAPPKHLLTVWDYNALFGGELYTVKWESDLLMELCDSVTDQMIEWGISGTKTILHTTVFATLMTAVTIPYSLAMASNLIDDTWAMAMERADRAGVELAKSLIDSHAGHRPVVLVGFSMGARVIYSCLKELTRQQEIWEDEQQKKSLPTSGRTQSSRRKSADEKLQYIREPASIIEDAIMMGMPNHVSLKSWEASRRVVAGRLINCYSRNDMILSLMFQLKRMHGILRPVCGTSPVVVNGVENYDVTDLVSAHTNYCYVTGEILKRVRHLQPQRPSISEAKVAALVTTINIANNIGSTPLATQAAVAIK